MTWKGNRMSRRHATRGKGGGRDSGLAKDPQGKVFSEQEVPRPRPLTGGRAGGRGGEGQIPVAGSPGRPDGRARHNGCIRIKRGVRMSTWLRRVVPSLPVLPPVTQLPGGGIGGTGRERGGRGEGVEVARFLGFSCPFF